MKSFHLFIQSPNATMDPLLGSYESMEDAEQVLAQRDKLMTKQTWAMLYHADADGTLRMHCVYLHTNLFPGFWNGKRQDDGHKGEHRQFPRAATV